MATDIGEIRIFSRDEKKQDDMRYEFREKMPEIAEKIKFSWRGLGSGVREERHARRGMHFPHGCAEAGALLLILNM